MQNEELLTVRDILDKIRNAKAPLIFAGYGIRLSGAAELLLTTDQTVTYIAMEVGYANVKTFNRNFLRFKVMTPCDFRKKVALQESRL